MLICVSRKEKKKKKKQKHNTHKQKEREREREREKSANNTKSQQQQQLKKIGSKNVTSNMLGAQFETELQSLASFTPQPMPLNLFDRRMFLPLAFLWTLD